MGAKKSAYPSRSLFNAYRYKQSLDHLEKNKPELQSGFEKMADIFSYGGNIYSELSAALDIVSEFFDVCRPHNEKTAKRSEKILSEKVRTYIEQNYAGSIKIEDIAENTGFCSQSGMSSKIRECYGVTSSEIRFE